MHDARGERRQPAQEIERASLLGLERSDQRLGVDVHTEPSKQRAQAGLGLGEECRDAPHELGHLMADHVRQVRHGQPDDRQEDDVHDERAPHAVNPAILEQSHDRVQQVNDDQRHHERREHDPDRMEHVLVDQPD